MSVDPARRNAAAALFLTLAVTLAGVACSFSARAKEAAPVATKNASPVKVLVYDSLAGSGSWGEYLEQNFKGHCSDCAAQMMPTRESAGVLGRLRGDQRAGRESPFDFVMGLDDVSYKLARVEGLVEDGKVFDQSPFAIIADTQRWPASQWPRKWSELASKLPAQLLVQDPRSSSPGLGWLGVLAGTSLLGRDDAKKITRRIFPSWSSSYDAFLKGEGKAVWSYRASEAYHRCNEKDPAQRERYLAVPLAEGYPVQHEWIARVSVKRTRATGATGATDATGAARGTSSTEARAKILTAFEQFVLSPGAQAAIASRNWMYPANPGTALPECFSKVTPLKELTNLRTPANAAELARWTDEWSL